MKGKKLLTLLFGLMLALGLATTSLAAEKGDVVILYTNDVHCGVDQSVDSETNEVTNIGYAGVAAYKKDLEAQLGEENVLLVDAGDAIQGEAIGTLSKGDYLVEIMNYLGYDYATYGNHEFDYGMDKTLALEEKADYTYLSCNFTDLKTGKSVAAPYAVIEAQGHKIALVGISTPESFTKSTPTYFQDENGNYIYGFCEGNKGQDLYDCVQAAIDAAKSEDAEIIIALGHLGIDQESSPWTSREVIANVSGLTAFIDGHSHSTIAGETVKGKDGKDVLLSSTGTKLKNLGQLVIKADGSVTTELVAAKDCTEIDPDTDAFVKAIEEKNAALLNTVVAASDVDLTINDPSTGKRMIRSHETNLGDLCADAYRTVTGADIAFVNGGGIRTSIAAGDITNNDIIKVHPFNNTACVVEATGQEIVDALEMASRSAPGESGGFLQVSGLMYSVDTFVESTVTTDDKGMFTGITGERRVSDVFVLQGDEYVPIDLDATYTLASHNYMLKSGGDGINMFMDNKILQDEVMLDNQVLITYIQDYLGGVIGEEYVNPYGEGRIFVDAPHFDDVTDNTLYYFYPALFLRDMEIMNGAEPGLFMPDMDITRGMLATMLYRMTDEEHQDHENSGAVYYTDVDKDAYFAEPIGWATEYGIVKGNGDDTFAPDQPITREELAVMLYRYFTLEDYDAASSEVTTAKDWAKVSQWAQDAMAWAVDFGVINGTENSALVLSPGGTATRAQAATMLYRALWLD